VFPVAETAAAEVTNVPSSADISLPICLKIRPCQVSERLLCPFHPCSKCLPAQSADDQTLVPNVSRPSPQTTKHLFQMSPGPVRRRPNTCFKSSKNAFTLVLLKLDALATPVASALRREAFVSFKNFVTVPCRLPSYHQLSSYLES
jgi:hypothetical protein